MDRTLNFALECRTKIVLFRYFWLELEKATVLWFFYISTIEFFINKISSKNKKILNLGPKIPYLGLFGLQFYYQIFNQPTRICETIEVSSKTKKKKLGTKNALFGSLAGMLKNYCNICNQSPPNCLAAKFRVKIRILKFGTKNALFGCFGQPFWKTIVIVEIRAFKFDSSQNLVQKNKILKFGTKKSRFSYFGAGTSKYYCHI